MARTIINLPLRNSVDESYNTAVNILQANGFKEVSYIGETVWKKEFDPEFDTKSVVTARQLKEEYQKIAEQYGCWFLAASEFTLPSNLDLEHLDEVGHQKLADAIYEKGQGFFTYGS